MDPNPPDPMADSGQMILRYFFCAREALADLPRCMASAADASRAGKRDTLSGCIALPDNTFFGARHRCSGSRPFLLIFVFLAVDFSRALIFRAFKKQAFVFKKALLAG